MKSRWGLFILLLGVLLLVAMSFKEAEVPAPKVQVIRVPVQTQEKYGVQLRLLQDTVLGPLDKETPNATAQIQKVRSAAVLEQERPEVMAAQSRVVLEVCDLLAQANREREYCEARLRESSSLVRHSLSRTGEQQRLDLERQRLLAQSVYLQRWDAYVAAKRPTVEQLLLRLYRMEHAGQSALGDPVHPDGTDRVSPSAE